MLGPTSAARPAMCGRARATRPVAAFVAALVTGLVLLAVGCRSQDAGPPPGTTPKAPDLRGAVGAGELAAPVAPVVSAPEGFVPADTRGVRLRPALGKRQFLSDEDLAKPTLPMQATEEGAEPGRVLLEGVVVGPDGPEPGATVRVERYVSAQFGRMDVTTDEDGKWNAQSLLGGRYRVRAFKAPLLTVVESQVAFLRDDGQATFDFTLEKFEGLAIDGALAVDDPQVGQRSFLKALVTRREVNLEGIVVGVGVPLAQVAITSPAGVRIIGSQITTTDGDGFASFVLLCTAEGPQAIVIGSGEAIRQIDLPACRSGDVAPENVPPPDVILFPVGNTFVTPYDGTLPAGTYVAVAGGSCGTSYEDWFGNEWVRNTTLEKGLVLQNPVRRLTPTPDTKPCTFRRTA